MKIGILGGTFNPVHNGHLALASLCLETFSLTKIIFVPAYKPPHKEVECHVSPDARLSMVKLAIAGKKGFTVSAYEIDKKGTSYTVDTIKYFYGINSGKDALYFITGADSAGQLEKWKDMDDILKLCVFVVATRPGWDMNGLYRDKILAAPLPTPDISSSIIRGRLKENLPITGLLPRPVENYIKKNRLYST